MSLFKKVIGTVFALALILGLNGCIDNIWLMAYGDDPFQPHFAEGSDTERGTPSGNALRVISMEVYEMNYPTAEYAKDRAWEFECPRKGVKVKEIVYGNVPEGCTEIIKEKPLKPGVVYEVSGSFHKNAIGGGGFIILDRNGEYELQYYHRGEETYVDWVAEVTNTPAATIINSIR